MAAYIIDPMNKWKIFWDTFVGINYMATLLLVPLVISFHFRPLQFSETSNFSESSPCNQHIKDENFGQFFCLRLCRRRLDNPAQQQAAQQ